MGIPIGEKGVLKLVYPGRHVEIFTQPITAAEVMRKNPRHCVARPDVFKFPYIVVRPESVLFPGRVFYVVPNRTIYRLLKARGQNQTPKNHDHHDHDHHRRHHRDPKPTSPRKPWAGTTPKHQSQHRCLKKQFQWDGVSFEEEDSDGRQIPQSYAEVKHRLSSTKNRNTYQDFEYESPVGSDVENLEITSVRAQKADPKNDNCKTEIERHERVKVLKSCLRKHDSVRKSLNRTVTFAFPLMTTSGESPALQQNI